jgi:cytoskeletal protein CcmA (bactofilin family)
MFKQKRSRKPRIDTLIGAQTRINGDVEFAGGFHLDGYINGNISSAVGDGAVLSVSEQGCIDGSVVVPNVILNGMVKGDIDASERLELGSQARVLGNVRYTVIETTVGAQIKGKLIHRVNPVTGNSEVGPKGEPPL